MDTGTNPFVSPTQFDGDDASIRTRCEVPSLENQKTLPYDAKKFGDLCCYIDVYNVCKSLMYQNMELCLDSFASTLLYFTHYSRHSLVVSWTSECLLNTSYSSAIDWVLDGSHNPFS